MKDFTNVGGNVTSFAGNVNFLLPSWISWPGAWFERFPEISRNHFHPERVVSFKERAEREARGHFHERVGETPVHWLPPGVGITPKPFFSTMAPNSSAPQGGENDQKNFLFIVHLWFGWESISKQLFALSISCIFIFFTFDLIFEVLKGT